jgi:nucleotide-binding universal stress UspA family protein
VSRGIAVAVDGTEASHAALAYAIDMARGRGFALTGVFVIDNGWADFIGNDWQSSRNARQGFLDYVLADQRHHAQLAREQFARAAGGLPCADFTVLVGTPAEALRELMNREDLEALVAGRRVYQACGRPSVSRLSRILARKLSKPLYLVD